MHAAINLAIFLIILLVVCVVILHDILGASLLSGLIVWGFIATVMAVVKVKGKPSA